MAALAAVQTNSTTSATTIKNKDVVNKDDFFKLLVAQLKNQDPTKPMDSTAFTAQLAQFSSLEKLDNVNASLTSLVGQQDLFNRVQSAQLAGKYVVAGGDQANSFTAAGKPVELGYDLPEDASQVLITIYDQNGRAVDMIEKIDQSKGMNKATWNNGSARTGNFIFSIAAFDAQGRNLGAKTLTEGTVSKVNFHDGRVYVTVNGKEIGFDEILSVTDVES
ncbi:MAG: flagellar hook assembly protein FlgD [Syntrophales bacterium]